MRLTLPTMLLLRSDSRNGVSVL